MVGGKGKPPLSSWITPEPQYTFKVMCPRRHGNICDVTAVWKPVLLNVAPPHCYNHLVVYVYKCCDHQTG
jgi:hypothetical protein